MRFSWDRRSSIAAIGVGFLLIAVCVTYLQLKMFGNAAIESNRHPRLGVKIRTFDSRLGRSDTVNGLDLAIDSLGGVHVAWQNAEGVLWHARVPDRGSNWKPTKFQATAGGTPRLVVIGDSLHLFFDSKLRHWSSSIAQPRWISNGSLLSAYEDFERQRPFLPEYSEYSDEPEVIASQGSILLVSRIRDNGTGSSSIRAYRLTAGRPLQRSTVAELGHGVGGLKTAPSVLLRGNELEIYFAAVESTHYALRLSRSLDQGLSWSTPTTVATSRSGAGDIEAIRYGGRSLLLVSDRDAGIPILFEQLEDGSFAPPRVLPVVGDILAGNSDGELASCGDSTSGRIFFLDARYQGTKTWLLNPLGLPWPSSWHNNDLMSWRLSDLLGHQTTLPPRPDRLTGFPSRTLLVRARAYHGQVHVVWAVKPNVRDRYDSGESPRLYYAVIPP